MEKRVGSRAIIFTNGKMLTMFRKKRNKEGVLEEYYVTPGGGREGDETLEENVIRELKEEFNVDIKVLGYLGVEENEKSINHFFHCEIVSGTPHLGGEELDRMNPDNYYEIREIPIEELSKYDIKQAKNKIEKALKCEYEDR